MKRFLIVPSLVLAVLLLFSTPVLYRNSTS